MKQFLSARAKAGIRVDFGRVPGKSTPLLKIVDRAAKRAAESGTELDRGLIVGKIGRAKTKGGAATMYPAACQVVAMRVYASRVVGKTKENRLKFELYNEATQQCGAKHFAYAQPEVGVELHRQHTYRVRMNANPKYPQIVEVLEEIPVPAKAKKPASAMIVSIAAVGKS